MWLASPMKPLNQRFVSVPKRLPTLLLGLSAKRWIKTNLELRKHRCRRAAMPFRSMVLLRSLPIQTKRVRSFQILAAYPATHSALLVVELSSSPLEPRGAAATTLDSHQRAFNKPNLDLGGLSRRWPVRVAPCIFVSDDLATIYRF